MELVNKNIILDFKNVETDLNVSIYFPTYVAGKSDQNRIGYKNAIKEVTHKLENLNMEEEAIKDFLKPLENYVKEQSDFWNYQSRGFVAFLNEKMFEVATLPKRFKPFTYVGNSFYFKPLLSFLEDDFNVLTMCVSPSSIRLFEVNRYEIAEVNIEDFFPSNLEESHWHVDKNKVLSNHDSGSTIFHGQGGGKDSKDERIKRFFRDVETGLNEMFRNEKRPLYLAGTDKTVSLFKESFHYNNIVENHISGNADDMKAEELYTKVEELLLDKRKALLSEEFHALKNILHTERVQTKLKNILKSSVTGRVEELYLKDDVVQWAKFDNEKLHVELKSDKTNGEVDVFDRAALQTILNGGKVKVVEEMPEGVDADMLAYLRN